MDERITRLAELLHDQTLERLDKQYPDYAPAWEHDAKVTVIPGQKYIKVNVGSSGKYMLDQQGNIYGCKGYGVIHRGHWYGTLDTIDQYYWGGYVAVRQNKGR